MGLWREGLIGEGYFLETFGPVFAWGEGDLAAGILVGDVDKEGVFVESPVDEVGPFDGDDCTGSEVVAVACPADGCEVVFGFEAVRIDVYEDEWGAFFGVVFMHDDEGG
ncbi:hypothetical protein KS4_18720 [Poriferisphaera corsica]|uniref:Uncharacterized protein n=1 Tax=Poriferisphaera corsica TaxID=2528020 RepID=A0A517YU89_9BACT|nr:hypothetical protein KS4_18720 [Poriferisphaera corsica]